MNCGEFREYINEYLDGTLPEEEKKCMDAHIGVCSDCASLEREYRQALTLCGELSPNTPDIVTPALNRIKSVRRARRTRWISYAAAAGIVLVLGTVALFSDMFSPSMSESPKLTQEYAMDEGFSGGAQAFDDMPFSEHEESMPAPDVPMETFAPEAEAAPMEPEGAPEEAPSEDGGDDGYGGTTDILEYARQNPTTAENGALFVHATNPDDTLQKLAMLYPEGQNVSSVDGRLAVTPTSYTLAELSELTDSDLTDITLVIFENIPVY